MRKRETPQELTLIKVSLKRMGFLTYVSYGMWHTWEKNKAVIL